jgi:hypothetical protein
MENYAANLSRTFNKNLDLVPWIGEKPYTQMLIWYFSNNLNIYDYVGKLPEQHWSMVVLQSRAQHYFLVESQDLRVEHTYRLAI